MNPPVPMSPSSAEPLAAPGLGPARAQVTGLVLAGGQGSRMGGVDKGLVNWRGQPLVASVLHRLAPQVGPMLINANRNHERYAALGLPVLPDPLPDHPGPLAGLLAGLQHCSTPWLVTVPCDGPVFPADLVERLGAAAVREGVPVAMAATLEDGQLRAQPVYALVRTDCAAALLAWLQAGERKVDRWFERQGRVTVRWDDPAAFRSANTVEELDRLQREAPGRRD